MPKVEKFISPLQASKILGVTRTHIYNLIRSEDLLAINIGLGSKLQSLRIDYNSLISFIKKRKIDPQKYYE